MTTKQKIEDVLNKNPSILIKGSNTFMQLLNIPSEHCGILTYNIYKVAKKAFGIHAGYFYHTELALNRKNLQFQVLLIKSSRPRPENGESWEKYYANQDNGANIEFLGLDRLAQIEREIVEDAITCTWKIPVDACCFDTIAIGEEYYCLVAIPQEELLCEKEGIGLVVSGTARKIHYLFNDTGTAPNRPGYLHFDQLKAEYSNIVRRRKYGRFGASIFRSRY